jgi:hypothetical protein
MSTTPSVFFAVLVLSGSAGIVAQTLPVPAQSAPGQILEELVATRHAD